MAETIQTISLAAFEAHGASRHPMALQHIEEVEFYAAYDGWYLGVLNRCRYDNDYSFAVLGPDPKGAKRWIGGGDSIKSIDDARTKLLAMLTEFVEAGKQIHKQD